MILIIILTIIIIIFFILTFIYKLFYFSKLNGKKLNNRIFWESNTHEYNPSIANNIIAIRYCNIEKKNLFSLIKYIILQEQKKIKNSIIIYKNNITINLNINLEDPRIFYHNNYYYIIAVDSATIKDNILPKLIKLDNNLNIINIQQFDISKFKKPVRQKNWNLFKDKHDNILMITDVYPKMIIKKVNLENTNILTKVEHNTSNFFPNIYKKAFIRCSTNFIPWKNNQLICILHLKKLIYIRSFFFTIENTYPYRPVKYSKIYHFFNERIEFASGIQWRNDKIVISLGINDYKGYVTEIDPSDIEFL
jgi:hypothetical protein